MMKRKRDFPAARPAVAPSLLSADFARLEQCLAGVEKAGASVLHLDVMDGHFVPNISLGVPVIKSIRACTELFFDAHLMISEPQRYAEAFAEAGCDLITFHVEAVTNARAVVEHIHSLGVSAGIALNPSTPAEAIEGVLPLVDLVLVMSVWPGFAGQKFIREVFPKVEQLRRRLNPHQRLEIDGGIDTRTIGLAVAAGADTLVAGTAVFGRPNPAAAFEQLQSLADAT